METQIQTPTSHLETQTNPEPRQEYLEIPMSPLTAIPSPPLATAATPGPVELLIYALLFKVAAQYLLDPR